MRLAIQQALTTELEKITPANGYAHDLAGRVYRGRVLFGEETEVPFLSILENPDIEVVENMSPAGGRSVKANYRLLIQGMAKEDPVHPTDPAARLLEDVTRRLFEIRDAVSAPAVGYLGVKGVIEFNIGHGIVRPADEVARRAHFWQHLDLVVVGRF